LRSGGKPEEAISAPGTNFGGKKGKELASDWLDKRTKTANGAFVLRLNELIAL
jgi:hypothetical protein